MKRFSLCLLLCLLGYLSGCSERQDGHSSEEAASPNNTEQSSTIEGSPAEPAFDLKTVQQGYQGREQEIIDISERSFKGRNALAVMLSVPLDPAIDHQRYFNVSLKGGGIVDGAWELSPSGKIMWFTHSEPNTEYVVTVYQGLKGANDKALVVTTVDVIHTRDLKASVNFDTRGRFLTEGLGNGLPVVTVNINEVNIDFFRIKDEHVQNFLRQMENYNHYYWNIDRLSDHGTLVHSGRYSLNATRNTRVKRSIDTRDIDRLKEAGIYLAVMLPAGKYQKPQLMWFSVTDLGLHARQYDQQLDIHVSSLKSGKPLTGIKISLFDHQSNLINESLTSPEGLASFQGKQEKARLIVAQKGQHLSVIQTRLPALDLSEFDIGKRPQLPVELFIYTARDVFRPGEVIDFSGLLRDGDGRKVNATVFNARIKRPDGSILKTFKWASQKLGYYYYPWHIPSDAPVGKWELEITGALKTPVIYSFNVEEFLPERMKLSFNHDTSNKGQGTRIVVASHETLKVPVLGEYLYGAPAAGSRLTTRVSVKPWRNPVQTLPQYQFGHTVEKSVRQTFSLKDLRLNQSGQAEIIVDSQWSAVRSPLEVKLISSLYESGGRPVNRVYSSLVWPSDSMIGIRSHFGDENPPANSRVAFDIVSATIEGELKAADNLELQLIREDRQYFWVYDESRGWHYEWTEKEFTEISQAVNISAGQSASVELPVSYGHYRLQVRDPENNVVSSLRFYAGYNGYADWQNVQSGKGLARPDRVSVTWDKEHYRAGDIAKATIIPPTGGEALVMVEGDGPLWSLRTDIPNEGITVDIPINRDWQQHNLYLTAMVLRKGDHKKALTPKRSFGVAHLALDRTSRRLDVSVDVPDNVLPEQTLNVKVLVKNTPTVAMQAKDKNLPVYMTLAAVDVGVLSISHFKTPDPYEAFFGRRRYSVESRDIYDHVIEVNNADLARLRFGGDADIARGGKEPQSDVQIVSLFSGLVDVKNGLATVPLTLPDFNGRLRIMATVFSADRFGSVEQEVTVASPVVTQVAMPRFLAMGDQATLALDINNLSGDSQTLTIQWAHQGPIKLAAKPRTLTLADKEKSTLSYPLNATAYRGQAQFSLSVTGDGIEPITRQWALGVRPAYPAVVTQKSMLLKPGQRFDLNKQDIVGLLPDSIEAQVSVSHRANLNLQSQLKNLLAYPYGCLEQTTSRAFPLTYATPDNQRRLGLQTLDEKDRINMIAQGIDRIASMQLANGGFGLWSNTSAEEHWLTAFAADFLLQARGMGVEVSAPLIDKTMRRLKQYVHRGGRFVGERWSQNNKHYSFAYKAYSAYVLSRVNQGPLGAMRQLFDTQLSHAQSGLPQVQLGIALIRMGDKKRGMQAIQQGLLNKPLKRQYLGDYGSPIRDKAMMIHLLLDNNLETKQALTMSFDLAEMIHKRRWLSTQERNALFLAGLSLESQLEAPWQATFFNGNVATPLNLSSAYRAIVDGAMIQKGLAIESQYAKPLFVNAEISGYSQEPPLPKADGLSITRTWYTTEGQVLTPASVAVGQLFIVHLEVSASERTPDALVVDLLPAGFELENQNLEHAIKLEAFTIDGKTISQLSRGTAIKHQEYRDDRFVAALDLNGYRNTNVFYMVRAVTPGTYKIPPALVEDMYRPERRGIGETPGPVTIKAVAY